MPPNRRQFIALAGSGGGGAVAGFVAGRQTAPISSTAPEAAAWASAALSPYGRHQTGLLSPTPRANRLLSFDLNADLGPAPQARAALGRLMRQWTGTIEALMSGVAPPGDTARDLAQPHTNLAVTVGWGRPLFAKVGLSAPAGLAAVPALSHDRLDPRWCGGDLLVVVGADDDTSVAHAVRRLLLDAEPFAPLRWEQAGSWRGVDGAQRPVTGRNLFGQLDGTANPQPGEPGFEEIVWLPSPRAWAGGTTMMVRRISMDLDLWDTVARSAQEQAVGRALATGAPLTGGTERDQPDFAARDEFGRLVIGASAHVRLAHPTHNGGARIVRRGFNYVESGARGRDSGLIFTSLQADMRRQLIPMLRRLDEFDALNEWTTTVGVAEFAMLPGFDRGGWLGQAVLGDS